MDSRHSFFKSFFSRFKKNRAAFGALLVFIILSLIGVYAPFFACSKPFIVRWGGEYYFPFLRFLFFKGFYTKPLDLFFNVFMFVLPLMIAGLLILSKKWHRQTWLGISVFLQLFFFLLVNAGVVKNPGENEILQKLRTEEINELMADNKDREELIVLPEDFRTWEFEKKFISNYNRLGLVLKSISKNLRHDNLQKYTVAFETKENRPLPTLKFLDDKHDRAKLRRLHKTLANLESSYEDHLLKWEIASAKYTPYLMALARAEHEHKLSYVFPSDKIDDNARVLNDILKVSESVKQEVIFHRKILEEYVKTKSAVAFIEDKLVWLNDASADCRIILKPFFRLHHWEEDTGMSGDVNKYLPWWEMSRANGRDLVASLLFGIRICLVVGFLGVTVSLIIGIAIGLISGYFGGWVDIIGSRFVEIWETMPVLFILLLLISISQIKSLFVNTLVLGLFGWTGFTRYVRAEVLRERELPYVLASKSMGYSHCNIMLFQILPNVFSCIIALFPFTMMATISSEAGLTFLGLGEENTTSWGALMREGVNSFPSESYLLWPPATLLTILLIAIAVTGDGIRDALDPRLRD
ncbi:MAG: ABC transporter permease subunit [Victivallaceae bacterium]